ncbi:Octicosapeptide/Phox/Bem1p protein, partial [Thalictrum thalictroides]
MENNSYADSGDSSPRSRDIDCENPSWEEQQPPSNYRVKFMCSFGGKIQPRPHDNQLTYIGGVTKILAVDRNIKFTDIMNRLLSLCDFDAIFKYQLPGEDLDALISVTNDEDLEHMMLEYDRIHRNSPKPPRLRIFLFLQKNLAPKSYDSNESKPNQQWLADSVNSVPIQSLDSSVMETPKPQDFLTGPPAAKLQDLVPPESDIQVKLPVEMPPRFDDRNVAEPVVSPTISQVEIQRQIHELQKLQIATKEQAMFRKNSDEALARAFDGEYYVQNMPEKLVPVTSTATVLTPQTYWQDVNGGAYTTGNEQPVYLIPSPAGMYQTSSTVQQVTGQAGQVNQGYYAMQQRVVQPDVYREQPVFSVGPPPQPKMIARPAGGMPVAETAYGHQVAYDSAGRQVYYTAAAQGSVMPTTYATVVGTGGMDLRQVGPLNVNQD